jgi:glycosyltransferase involved in cell wall biosynthesis
MTVRDGARYLAQALESARAQTFSDWELVLWDDGSTDATLEIARSFADRDARIRVFTAPVLGRRRALGEAHRRARGAYLGWLDADDWLAPDALARTHAAIQSTGADMVYTDHIEVDVDGALRGPGRRTRIPYSAHRLLLDFMTFHFRLFTRDVFDRAGGISPQREIAIDYDLCLRISEHGRIERVPEPLYFYRMHGAQMSTRQRAAQIAASADAIRAALARRGMTPSHELVVDLQRGKFRLERKRVSRWRLALETAFPRPTLAEPFAGSHVTGLWPAAGPGIADLRPLGNTLASLMRAVWTGTAGDTLRIFGLAPLFEPANDGSVLGACWLFIRTIDHARARRMRIIWAANEPLTAHPHHAKREQWCRRELAARCHRIEMSSVGDAEAAQTELGVSRDRITIAAPKSRAVGKLVERRRSPGAQPISIVIPLRNRAGADVRNALASLAWQDGGGPWETILVSQGSDPSIDLELLAIAREAGATLITVGSSSDEWCKSLALNTGIRATDPAIAFVMTMDGDMLLAENFLSTVLSELREDPRKIVLCQSSDLPEASVLRDDPAAVRDQFAELRASATLRGRYGTGGIQATSRSFLIEARGYDEDMLWWGALDTDLVRRAEVAGLRPAWITDRTAMLHQWHPRKHSILSKPGQVAAAQSSWQRNHELMIERARNVTRNHQGWGAVLDARPRDSVTRTSPK